MMKKMMKKDNQIHESKGEIRILKTYLQNDPPWRIK